MSAGNFFETKRRATDLRTVTLTNASTYTVRTGGTTYNFIEDAVINVITTASGNDLTITVPDGTYPGQRLIVNIVTEGDDEVTTITTTTGDDNTLDTEGDYAVYEWTNTTSGWQKVHGEVAS